MEKEFLYLPKEQRDTVSDPIELRNGRAALLYIQGDREEQQDALWAKVHEGKLILCSSDGVHQSSNGAEMAKWVVEFAQRSVRDQLKLSGIIRPGKMQRDIRDGVFARNPYHQGQATALCMVIDGLTVHANRIGDPDIRVNQELYPHPNLVPENNHFAPFSRWWAQNQKASALDKLSEFSHIRGTYLLGTRSIARALTNCHTGQHTDVPEVELQPSVEIQLKPGDRFLAGTDGLAGAELNDWQSNELRSSMGPQYFLTALWAELERRNGENASGVAFFSH